MQHPVYPDMREKEKIFGGILTAGEFAWILGFSIVGVILGLLAVKVVGAVGLVLFIPFCGAGCFMAFYKKHEMSMIKYLMLKRKYKKKLKRYPNRRAGKVLTIAGLEEE